MLLSSEVTALGRSYRSIREGLTAVEYDVGRMFENAGERIAPVLKGTLKRAYENTRRRNNKKWTRTGLFGSTGGSNLQMRSGRGLISIRDSISVSASGNEIEGKISAGKLSIHETGGTMTARGRYLAIPTVFALDSRGVEKKRGPGAYTRRKTFVHKTRNGNLFVFRREQNRIVPLYLLKRSVTLPARLGLGQTIERGLPRFEQEAANVIAGDR